MTYHRKRQSQIVSRKLTTFISNWNTRSDLGGAATPLGAQIPASADTGWPFGDGDLILFAEFVGNDSATIPTEVIPTGYTKIASATLTDGVPRGCRLVLSYKIGSFSGDFTGSVRVSGMACPTTSALSSYRCSMVKGFYMSRPIRSITVGTPVAGQSSVAVGPITIPATDAPVSGYDYDMIMQVMVLKGDGAPTDANYTLSPQKGTEYYTYPNRFGRLDLFGLGTGSTANAKIFVNCYTHGDPPANFSGTMADTGAGNFVLGATLKIR